MLSALASEPGVRLPGARRHEARLRAETEGVEVPLELLDELLEKLEGFAASA
jgi:LDH2 family malate/lactate/ureidoglycolate dehydrogenase